MLVKQGTSQMDLKDRRGFLCVVFGATLAASAAATVGSGNALADFIANDAIEGGTDSTLEPTQAIVVRPGRRRGPAVVVAPRRRRPRWGWYRRRRRGAVIRIN